MKRNVAAPKGMTHGPAARRGFLRGGLVLGGAVLAPRLVDAAATTNAASTEGAGGAQGAPAPAALKAAPSSQAGASPRLTFHAVDTYHGATGAGMKLELSRFDGKRYTLVKTALTNAGGRTDEPLLIGDAYQPGRYELLMHVDSYFKSLGAPLPSTPFLSQVPLRFVIHDASQRVHLPVLFSPWGYSYYRGS